MPNSGVEVAFRVPAVEVIVGRRDGECTPENIDAALTCLGGALLALNEAGREFEHELRDGLWVYVNEVLVVAHPGVDRDMVRCCWVDSPEDGLPAAVREVRAGWTF